MAALYSLLVLEALITICGTLLFARWWQRHAGASWATWLWGGAAFITAQLIHIPVLLGLTALGKKFPPAPAYALWINILVLGGTAGLFENLSRYLFLKGPAKKARLWRDGVMFGAGHGGVEAILLIGGAVTGALVMLLVGDEILAQIKTAKPDQASEVAAQIGAIRAMQWWTPLVAIWERIMAITLHIALSLLVLRAVVRGELRWLWLAILFHAFVDGIAVGLQQTAHGNIALVEGAVTLLNIVSVAIIIWTYQAERKESVPATVEPP
ncbi:MAG: YhfC family intramembrane metalloprotease [Chthoniobacterales bacterium]